MGPHLSPIPFSRRAKYLIAAASGLILIFLLRLQPEVENGRSGDASMTPVVQAGLNVEHSTTDILARQSLSFILNQGQLGEDVRFHATGIGHTILFRRDAVTFRRTAHTGDDVTVSERVTLRFEGANPWQPLGAT